MLERMYLSKGGRGGHTSHYLPNCLSRKLIVRLPREGGREQQPLIFTPPFLFFCLRENETLLLFFFRLIVLCLMKRAGDCQVVILLLPTKATQIPRFLIYFTTTTAAIPYVHPRLPDLTFSPILSFSRFVSDFSFPQEGGGGPDARIKITRTTTNFPSFLQSEEKKKKKERKETPSNNLDFCVCGKLFHPPSLSQKEKSSAPSGRSWDRIINKRREERRRPTPFLHPSTSQLIKGKKKYLNRKRELFFC